MKFCLLLLALFPVTTQASTLVVTTHGHTSTLTSNEGYNFQAIVIDDRFIRLVVNKPEGETWALLLGVPQGQTLADGFYEPIPGNDSFDAYPNMLGAGFSIAGTNPLTGTMGGANTTSGSFTLSGLGLTGSTVNAFRLDFDVRANGRQTGYAEFNPTSVPEPGSTFMMLCLGLGVLTIHRRKTK
ncbi:MAG: hypothetical protein RJB39_496 [Candidatus Parcubacteria bacterium]|jgi:hypothetical protein